MTRPARLAAFGFVFVVAFSAAAQEGLSPQKVGKIEYERDKELEKVQKEYGNRKPSELSKDERAEMAEKQKAATQRVLESNGVDDKDYARYTSRMGADDRATAKDATKAAERADIKKEVKAELDKKEGEPEVVPYEGADPAQRTPSKGGRTSSGGKHSRGR